MTTILHIIVITIITNQLTTGQYTYQKLNNTGIFFEKLDKLNLFTSQLTILTTINLPETRELTDPLINCANNFRIICEEIRTKNPSDLCKPLMKELDWHITQIQKDDIKIKEMYGRQKRGLIDIGGKFQKFLFGTMDADDSQKIYNKLEKLTNRQANIIKLENQHIAVLQSNFDALSKPISQLQNETYELEDKLNQIIKLNKDLEQKVDSDHRITELLSLIMVQCLHINKIQEEATEIIQALENKYLHPLVIPFTKLSNLITKEFPEANNIIMKHETLRKLAEIDYIEIDGKLIVKITIPNVNNEDYIIYKPYLIPIKINNTYKTFMTETEYIATNTEHSKTMELYAKDLNACKHIQNNYQETKVCRQTQPILTIPNPHCLSNLLVDPINSLESCRTLPIKPSDTFIRMENENSWLHILTKTTSIRIQCKNKTETVQMKGTGIITFTTSCKLTTKEFAIEIAGVDKTVKIEQPKMIYTLSEEDIRLLNNNNLRTNKQTITPITSFRNNVNYNKELVSETQKISHLRTMVNELDKEKSDINPYQINILNPYVITIITIIAAIAIITIIITYKKNKLKKITKQTNNKVITIESREKTNPRICNFIETQQGINIV